MEPIGLCGGGLVALLLLLVLVVGAALVSGGVVLALARLGVAVDAWFKPKLRSESDTYTLEQSGTPSKSEPAPDVDRTNSAQ